MFNVSNKMSIQDESFPADEFFEDLANFRKQHRPNNLELSKPCSAANENGETSQQNVSLESSNTSATTCVSDPDGNTLNDAEKNKLASSRKNKAFSHLDIHSAYTKRRFKHVPSKVGQYIAQIKADEEKRKCSKNFQRHNSMPETLTPNAMSRNTAGSSSHRSADELHQLNESTNSEADAETSNLSSNEILVSDGVDTEVRCAKLLHENERLVSYNDYLQGKIDEKVLENITLKRYMDEMRIELCALKERKRSYSNLQLTGNLGTQKRDTTRTFATKAIQTDLVTPMSHPLLHDIDISVTPDVSNSINHFESNEGANGGTDIPSGKRLKSDANGKSVATIQPLSLNFSNESVEVESNVNTQQRRTTNRLHTGGSNAVAINNNSGTSQPSSNDSAIEMETVESHPTGSTRFHVETSLDTLLPQRDGFYYFQKRSRRYISLENINVAALNGDGAAIAIANESGNTSSDMYQTMFRKKPSLGRRMLSIFGPCGSCDDINQSLDTTNATYAGMPLLERGGH